jgi:hypothetical protein
VRRCRGTVNIDADAFNTYTADHPTLADGTVVEGMPSEAYWLFVDGEREPASANEDAVRVDDGSLIVLW